MKDKRQHNVWGVEEMGLVGEESASHEWVGGLKKNPKV
jgi:hypothetical protein